MYKFNKFIAFALAATMVVGSSVTAFATEPVTDSTGTGGKEGHVDLKKTNVILPTTVANTTFSYTIDPEKLIEQTAHEKYGDDVVFPASNDTYVYFNTGKDTDGKDVYANTSAPVTITNKSSHDIDLTVKATATTVATDVPMVAKDAYAAADKVSLYLGLVVGSETPVAIDAETPATKTVTVAGTPTNYKIAVKADKSDYEYRELTLTEYQALPGNESATQGDYDDSWATTDITLEGGVTSGKAITKDTTAPEINVTWSWVDPDASTPITDFAWSSSGQYFYFAIPGVTQVDMTKVTGFVAKQGSVSNPVATPSKSSSGGYITVTWNQIKQGMTWPNAENPTATIDFTITYDGADYTCTYSYVAP